MRLSSILFLFLAGAISHPDRADALTFSQSTVQLNSNENVWVKNLDNPSVKIDSIRIVSEAPLVGLQFAIVLDSANLTAGNGGCLCALMLIPDSINNNIFIGGERYPSPSGMYPGVIILNAKDSLELVFGPSDYILYYDLSPHETLPRDGNKYHMVFYRAGGSDTLDLITHARSTIGISALREKIHPQLATRFVNALGRKMYLQSGFRYGLPITSFQRK